MYAKLIALLVVLGLIIGGVAWIANNPVVLAVILTIIVMIVIAIFFFLGGWWTKRVMESGAQIANAAIQYGPEKERLKTERARLSIPPAPAHYLPAPGDMQNAQYIETDTDRQMIDTSGLIIENLPPYESED